MPQEPKDRGPVKQKTIEFDRVGRINMIRAVQIPTPPADWNTSAALMKEVLMIVDDMIGNKDSFPVTAKCLAGRMQRSKSAVKRATGGLQKMGLLEVTRTGRAPWHTINWEAVKRLVPDREEHSRGRRVRPLRAQSAPPEGAECAFRGRRVRLQRAQSAPPEGAECALGSVTENITENPTATAYRDWPAAAAEFARAGVELSDSLASEASTLGYELSEITEIVDTYLANRSKFNSAGAVAFRVRRRDWPEGGIRSPAEIEEARQRAEARRTAGERDRAAVRAEQREREVECTRLEAVYGSSLNAMAGEQLEALLAEALPTEFEREQFRRRRSFGRLEVLRALAAREGR